LCEREIAAEQWSGLADESERQAQPALGRVPDAIADRMDKPDVRESCCSRIDELRLIGNGVDPFVAEHAFRTLMARYFNPPDIIREEQTELF
jgi:hypothetical protein